VGVKMKKDWRKRITTDKKILSRKPIIKGTRISVEFILELLDNGWTYKQILDNYPQQTREDLEVVKHVHEVEEAIKLMDKVRSTHDDFEGAKEIRKWRDKRK
jgi:uncharacterized protein (DUF433 family)